MGIRKLPSGSFQARIKINGVQQSKTCPTIEAAQQWLSSFESPELNTIASLSDSYLKEVMTIAGKQRGGYESIKYKLLSLSRRITIPIEEITKETVNRYKNNRVNEVSGSTARLEIQLLSRLLRWAASEKGIDCSDITKGVKLPEPGKARERIIEPLEYSMILEKVSERAKPIVILAWETAMRRNEILAITPAMVNLKKRVIHLADHQTKNGCSRDVPLSKVAMSLLETLCDGREWDKPIFTLTPYATTQAFRRAARLANVNGCCFHSLRHSAITRAAMKGMSIPQLQVVSGHKSLSQLQRYTHIKAESVADLLD